MKKNKKGFTLVELLAVIVILGIILTIAGTNVVKSIKIANQQEVDKFAKMLTNLGPDVYINNKNSIGPKDVFLTDDTLKSAGYLKSTIKLGKEDCEAELYIKYNGGEPIYSSYVNCKGASPVGTQEKSFPELPYSKIKNINN